MKVRLLFGVIVCLTLLVALGSTNGVQAHHFLNAGLAGPGSGAMLAIQQPDEVTQIVAMSAVGDPVLRVDWLAWQGGQLNQVPSPPAPNGWQAPGFDDGSWASTVAVHYAPWDSLPFCNEIGGGTVAHPDGGINEVTYLVRKHFTIPDPPAGHVLAEVRAFGWADNGTQVWLNGQFIGGWFMSQEPHCTDFFASSTAPHVGDNVLAIQLSNNDERDASGNPVSVNPIGVAFQLEAVYRVQPTPTPTPTPSVADLAVTKTVDNAAPNEGDTITYTVTVTNNGPDAATDVSVTDLLPAGLTFASATPSQGSYNNGTGVWSTGNLAGGASATLTITATVDAGTGGSTVTNTASAEANELDPDPSNNASSADLTVLSADLAVAKTVDNAAPNEGDTITYTVTVANNGPDAATDVSVTDLLPAGLTFASATPSQGSYDSGTGVWAVGDLANGSSATLTITATVDAGTAGSTITNTASAEANEADPDPSNNASSSDLRVPSADLTVTKTADNPSPGEGDSVTYTISVTNNGPDAATNVSVTDLLPAGLTFVSATPSQGSYDNGTGVWTVGDLANGTSATLTITATVDPDTSGLTIANAAEATGDQSDPDPGNNGSTVDITVPLPPPGTDKLSARVFIDDRCDSYFQERLDVPLAGVPVKIRFLANGAAKTRLTTPFGLVYFAGFDSSGGVEVSVSLPASYMGYALGNCFNSPTSVLIPGSEFDGGVVKHKHADFSAEVLGEIAGR